MLPITHEDIPLNMHSLVGFESVIHQELGYLPWRHSSDASETWGPVVAPAAMIPAVWGNQLVLGVQNDYYNHLVDSLNYYEVVIY